MKTPQRICAIVALAGLTAACATERTVHAPVPAQPGEIYKVGNPYQIDGTWYYPKEQPDYDETGIASWYGPSFYGQRTANGEIYDASDLTAAHRTLPMPVNVRVTNLENGKSVVLRVNDRGPYAKGRIIDVSEHAAKLLGFYGRGTARVRVTYLSRANLPNGRPAEAETPAEIANAVPAVPAPKVDRDRLADVPEARVAPPVRISRLPQPAPDPAPPDSAAPTGEVSQVPVPAVTHLYVQVGAFGSYDNAMRLRDQLGEDLRISTTKRNGQTLYRVRTGPLDSTEDADAALARLSGLGSNDAHIVVDQ
ncbi:MAG TPA: septal ring lytic transglycosylase RlpA family protein [Rhizomicrobium sp.]|jgi:rare lipoprotein A|nr:septal ring lytic transglycosylase RlpA family protein [Rhizomicrobium sp.]